MNRITVEGKVTKILGNVESGVFAFIVESHPELIKRKEDCVVEYSAPDDNVWFEVDVYGKIGDTLRKVGDKLFRQTVAVDGTLGKRVYYTDNKRCSKIVVMAEDVEFK